MAFSVEIVFSFFTKNGNISTPSNESELIRMLNPALDSCLTIFPLAKITVYTDFAISSELLNIIPVDSPFDVNSDRYGWRSHDYYQAFGLLNTVCDYAIAIDSDMLVISKEFKTLISIVDIFGVAFPLNPRLICKVDGTVGTDSNYSLSTDPLKGLGISYNLMPIAYSAKSEKARTLLIKYMEIMLANPGRGATSLCLATYETQIQPFVLAPQWCVCASDIWNKYSKKYAIALHVGHKLVYPAWVAAIIFTRTKKVVKKFLFG